MPRKWFRTKNPACWYCSHPESEHSSTVGCKARRKKRKCPCTNFRRAPKNLPQALEPKSPIGYTRLMNERARKLKKGTWVHEVGGGLQGSKR